MPDVDQALSEAHIAAGKAHMHNLAMLAQNYEPDATVVMLSQSDQGDWLDVDGFLSPLSPDSDPDVAYDFDDDGEAMGLYTDVYVMRELYAQYDVRGEIEYSDRMGLRSFHMDIAKVLAELGSTPAPTWPTHAGEKAAYESWQFDVEHGHTILGFREWLANKPGKVYDHIARPDDDTEPGDRCKDCGEDITWIGVSSTLPEWLHVDDIENQ